MEDEAVEKEDDGCGIDLPWAGGGPLRTASVDHFIKGTACISFVTLLPTGGVQERGAERKLFRFK